MREAADINVKAKCKNRKCNIGKILTERIFDTLEMRQSAIYTMNKTKEESKAFICFNCEERIEPKIYLKYREKDEAPPTKYIKLLHFHDLRRKLEDDILMIDNGYRRVHNEEDVMMPGFLHTLRTKDDEQLFWNLIYYFNMFHLPFEFMLPYKTSD